MLFLSCLPAAGLLAAIDPARAAEPLSIRVDGELPRVGDSEVYVDDAARLVYRIDRFDGRVVLYDADTLGELGVLTGQLASPSAPSNAARGAVDRERGLLYLLSGNGANHGIVVVDGPGRRLAGFVPLPAGAGQSGHAISYDSARGKAFLVVAPSAANPHPSFDVSIWQVDPAAGLAGRTAVDWTAPINGCPLPAVSLAGVPGVPADPTRNFVYFLCTYTSFNATGPRPSQGVVRLPFGPSGPAEEPELFRLPGDYKQGGAVFDAVSERMVVITRNFGPQGEYVFDGRHGAVVGLIDHTGNTYGACLNRQTGRYYVAGDTSGSASNTGFATGDARPTPPDRGRALPSVSSGSVPGLLACDPVTNRVFAPYSTKDGPVFRVLRDTHPPFAVAPELDPDAFTQDIDDSPNTAVTFQGVSRGFGARLVEVGGPGGVVTDFLNVGLWGLSAAAVQTLGANRMLTLGVVGRGSRGVSLSNSSGSVAVAIGVDADDGTVAAATTGGEWPYPAAECSASNGGEKADDGQDDAAVVCDPEHGSSSARAAARLRNLGDLVIEGAQASGRVWTDADRGVVATTTASVDQVVLNGGAIVLEGVRSTATSWARGRPGQRGTERTSEVGRLVINGQTMCQPCDPADAAAFINASGQSNVVASLPKADAVLAAGTPKGAAAAVIRDPYEQMHDEVMNRVPPDDQQVPALRLTLQEDAFQHAALLLDLAAPQAATFRGLSGCASCGADTPTTRPPDEPPIVQLPEDAPPLPWDGDDGANASRKDATGGKRRGGSGVLGPVRDGLASVARGLQAVLTDPDRIPMLLLVWSVLAAPIYLSARRRLLAFDEGDL